MTMMWLVLAVQGGIPWEAEAEARLAVGWYDGKEIDGVSASLGLRYGLPSDVFLFARWSHGKIGGRDEEESGEHTDPLCALVTLGLADCTWHDTKRTTKIDLESDELLAGAGFRLRFRDTALAMDVSLGVGALHYDVEESESVVSKGVLVFSRKDDNEGWGAAARFAMSVSYAVSPVVRLQAGADLDLVSLEGVRDNRHTVTTLGLSLGILVGF